MSDNLFGAEVPNVTNADDGTDLSLGTLWTPDVNGTVTHARWYFPNPVPNAAVKFALYRTSDSANLGGSAFPFSPTPPTAGAWAQQAFPTPIAVQAGVQYMIVVWTPNTYVATGGYAWPKVSGHLSTPSNAGRFVTGIGDISIPGSSFNNGNYFADLVFEPAGGTTSVTGAVDLRWRVSNTVSSTSDLRWRVSTTLTATVDLRWKVSVTVSAATDLRWAVSGAVTSALDLRWAVLGVAGQTLDLRWGVSGSVLAALSLLWAASGRVIRTLDLRWAVISDAPPVDPETFSTYRYMSPVELMVQRRMTAFFISADRTPIILQRNLLVPDGGGGYKKLDTDTLPLQWFRIIPQQDTAIERTTADGRKVSPEYVLLGTHDSDMKRGDRFKLDGRRYEIVFVAIGPPYERKGEVAYLGG
jgi:hypothetical protein